MLSRPYTDLPDMPGYYLEDSYVLAINASPGRVLFRIDAVVTQDHPDYQGPKPGEYYDFRPAILDFRSVKSLHWRDQGRRPSTDAAGAIDFGNIDAFTWEGDEFRLEGEWGEMVIVGGAPHISLEGLDAG